MFDSVHEIAIIVTAVLAIAVGSIWYSPLLFGKHWMKALGLTADDLEIPETLMVRSVVYATLSNILLFGALALLISQYELKTLTLFREVLYVSIIAVAVLVNIAVWERRSFTYLMIHVGYIIVALAGGAFIIARWPW